MEVTPACYAHLVNSLMGFACGRVAVFLEVNCVFALSHLKIYIY